MEKINIYSVAELEKHNASLSNSESEALEEFNQQKILTERFSKPELLIMWISMLAMLAGYFFCNYFGIPARSIIHAKLMYAIFVSINIISAIICIKALLRTPTKSDSHSVILLLTIGTASAAIGNFLDYIFWLTNFADFKEIAFNNIFFLIAIILVFPSLNTLSKLCKVEFNNQPIIYSLIISGFYVSLPFLMNHGLIDRVNLISNKKEFIFGMIYALSLGYMASMAIHLWKNAKGKLMQPAQILSFGLVLMSIGCAIYAGLFPKFKPSEIPSSPVHLIIALSYITTSLGIRRIELTINSIYSLKSTPLPPYVLLVELFGPSKGMDVYKKMQETIEKNHEQVIVAKAESKAKEMVIQQLESEVNRRKATELALIEAKNKAEEANKTKSQFLAMMSHELKTPLTAIKGYGRLIMNESGPIGKNLAQPVRLLGERIYNSSNHLQSLIDSILRFSQLEAGKFTYQKEVFDLTEVIENVRSVINFQLASARTQLEISFPEGKVVLETDKFALQQTIINLVVNAFKFCKEGKVFFNLEIRDKDLYYSVTDTGIGIAQEDVDKIFSPFFQVSHGNKRKYGGTGLGLSIVKKLVTELGGTIDVSSEQNKGTKFEILLPEVIHGIKKS